MVVRECQYGRFFFAVFVHRRFCDICSSDSLHDTFLTIFTDRPINLEEEEEEDDDFGNTFFYLDKT